MINAVRRCCQQHLPLPVDIGFGRNRATPTGFDGDAFTRISESPNGIVSFLLQHHLVAEKRWQTYVSMRSELDDKKQNEN